MNGSGMINFFSTCFLVCLILSILFFVAAVVMFFAFNIPLIFNIRTGRAKRKTIEEMQRANSETGRLRRGDKSLTSKLGGNNQQPQAMPGMQQPGYSTRRVQVPSQSGGFEMTDNLSDVMNNRNNVQQVSMSSPAPVMPQAPVPPQAPAMPQAPSPYPAADSNFMQQGYGEAMAETSLLSENYGETSLLTPEQDLNKTTLLSDNSQDRLFRIISKIEFIHTDEIIC